MTGSDTDDTTDDLEEHRERVRKIIERERDILDRLAAPSPDPDDTTLP